MGDLSTYAKNKLGDHLLGTASFTMPAQVYLALYTTATDDGSGGTEVTGGSYVRQPVDFDACVAGVTDATADVSFPQASADWGTVTHAALTDASTAGNRLAHKALAASKLIETGDTFKVLASDLDFSMD